MGRAQEAWGAICKARRGGRCGAIVDEPQQSRWPPTPCARMGCRGTAPPAVLSLLNDVQRHRRRRDALHLGLRPARDLWRDACALGCAARSDEEDDAGGISDEKRHSRAPRPRRPSGLPLGRASPLAALLPVLPARNRRAFADPSRPREQRAESPPRARPHNARRGEEGDAVPSWTSRNKADGPQSPAPEWVAAARPRLPCCRS